MMQWIYGFFMAWGMFLVIPCPFPRWDEKAREKMMICLPLIGGIVGGLWVLVAWLTGEAAAPIRAFAVAVTPWLCTGFMHLDGYMDVCDAVLSRRDLETRQRILKDSHCGAFAVIGIVLLVLAQWSVVFSAEEIRLVPLLLIPVATRACASLAVLTLPPMKTSQYSRMEHSRLAIAIVSVILALAVCVPMLFFNAAGFAPMVAALVYWLCCACGFRQLKGMNGDISGFSLTLGEFAGLAVLCFVG